MAKQGNKTVKIVRTTVNSTLFSGESDKLAELLVKNTDGNPEALKQARETFLKAMDLVPNVLKERHDAARQRAETAQEKANRLAAELMQTSTELQQGREMVRDRMLQKLLSAGIPQAQAEERVERELSALDGNIERINSRLAAVKQDVKEQPEQRKGTDAKRVSTVQPQGTLSAKTRVFHVQ